MALAAFSTADRALFVKRRKFSKEITVILDETKSEVGLNKESFDEKRPVLSNIGKKSLLLRKIVLA